MLASFMAVLPDSRGANEPRAGRQSGPIHRETRNALTGAPVPAQRSPGPVDATARRRPDPPSARRAAIDPARAPDRGGRTPVSAEPLGSAASHSLGQDSPFLLAVRGLPPPRSGLEALVLN